MDDRSSDPGRLALPLAIDGGSVSPSDLHAPTWPRAASIDVSGGVGGERARRGTYGRAGSIADPDGERSAPDFGDAGTGRKARAGLHARRLFRRHRGSADDAGRPIQIGGTRASHPGPGTAAPEFFGTGGFTSYALRASERTRPADPSASDKPQSTRRGADRAGHRPRAARREWLAHPAPGGRRRNHPHTHAQTDRPAHAGQSQLCRLGCGRHGMTTGHPRGPR